MLFQAFFISGVIYSRSNRKLIDSPDPIHQMWHTRYSQTHNRWDRCPNTWCTIWSRGKSISSLRQRLDCLQNGVWRRRTSPNTNESVLSMLPQFLEMAALSKTMSTENRPWITPFCSTFVLNCFALNQQRPGKTKCLQTSGCATQVTGVLSRFQVTLRCCQQVCR